MKDVNTAQIVVTNGRVSVISAIGRHTADANARIKGPDRSSYVLGLTQQRAFLPPLVLVQITVTGCRVEQIEVAILSFENNCCGRVNRHLFGLKKSETWHASQADDEPTD